MNATIKHNYSLENYITFHINTFTKYFIEFNDKTEIIEFVKIEINKYPDYFILGGGSNLLFLNHFKGLVIHPNIKGINVINENDDFVFVEAKCGENWDEFVEFCVNKRYGGIENLSKIPGNVGAAPIQNIGAYGVEVKDVINKVIAIEMGTGKEVTFSNSECKFGYRDSIFKNKLKDKYIVTDVIFKLDKKHKLNTGYGKVMEELSKYKERNISTLRKAINHIREEKLPDPDKIGNAGSFFQNPVINNAKYENLINSFPSIPSFPVNNENKKIPAAWLIEQCGWKGKRVGDAGVYPNQPLVLVNYGNATGEQIFTLSEKIKESVFQKFSINLEREVKVIGEQ